MPFSLSSYDYSLPNNLIASYPLTPKESAKLLVYNRKKASITHTDFYHFFNVMPKDCLVVLNNTRVIKARLYGVKKSGGKSEILFHRFVDNPPKNAPTQSPKQAQIIAQVKHKAPIHTNIYLDKDYSAEVIGDLDNGYKILAFFHNKRPLNKDEVFKMLDVIGHTPLPPYIKRDDEAMDRDEYQSVFATINGAIAAPTASLHFSPQMFKQLESNFKIAYITLHIGAGTFFGVQKEDIREHTMHKEYLHISAENANLITHSNNIFCVGTTAARGVETLARANIQHNAKNPNQHFFKTDFSTNCDLFLHLGNPPIKTNYLLTNFHLPKSSLLMLVASMVGLDECRRIYSEAISKQYRFFSYGDGMMIV